MYRAYLYIYDEAHCMPNVVLKEKMYAISSDTHQLQFIKLHHFKQERF